MPTTPFVLTNRDKLYPHDQLHNLSPVKTVSAVFSGADVAAYKGSAVATSDVTQLISIPAGSLVLTVTHKVTTVEGATCTYGIGDGTSTSGYVSAANGNTTTDASSFNGDPTTPDFGNGKYYAAADTIDLILSSGTAAAVVVKVSVTYVATAPVGV